jgi:hypothetical protein
MSNPRRNGRPTTITLCPEAYEVLQELAPGPKKYGVVVSQLLVAERVRRQSCFAERARLVRELLEEAAGKLVGV